MGESEVVGLGSGELLLQAPAQILFLVPVEAPAMSRTEYGKLIEDNLDVVPIKPGHYEEVFPLLALAGGDCSVGGEGQYWCQTRVR